MDAHVISKSWKLASWWKMDALLSSIVSEEEMVRLRGLRKRFLSVCRETDACFPSLSHCLDVKEELDMLTEADNDVVRTDFKTDFEVFV